MQPLALMNQLYDIERRAMKMNDQERGELRTKESRRILDRLSEYLEGPVAKSVLPASKLGGAFNYIRNHWEALNVFVNDRALPIDNDQVERLMKPIRAPCKMRDGECARICARVNNTSNRSDMPRVEDAPDPARAPRCRHRPSGAGASAEGWIACYQCACTLTLVVPPPMSFIHYPLGLRFFFDSSICCKNFARSSLYQSLVSPSIGGIDAGRYGCILTRRWYSVEKSLWQDSSTNEQS